MAQASKKAKAYRLAKRKATVLRRTNTAMQRVGIAHYMTLLGVLAQAGGTVTLSIGTMEQVRKNAARMSYQMKPSANPGEFDVVLMVDEPAEAVSSTSTDPGVIDTIGYVEPIEATLTDEQGVEQELQVETGSVESV